MWEIIDDSRHFFQVHCIQAILQMEKCRSPIFHCWTTSSYKYIFRKNSDRPSFPMEWRINALPIRTLAAERRDRGQPVPAPPPNNLQQELARQHQLFHQIYTAFGVAGGYGQQFGGRFQHPPMLPPHAPSSWPPLPGTTLGRSRKLPVILHPFRF